MWISKARYTELVKAETRAEWLVQRTNQLEIDCGNLRAQITGQPQVVPLIRNGEATPKPEAPDLDDFSDMGDELANKHGARWNDFGEVTYNG